jgi:pyrophosphatase PpaX
MQFEGSGRLVPDPSLFIPPVPSNASLPHKAILFDLDGTLLDTFDFIFSAFEHSLSLHSAPIPPRPEIAIKMGGPLEDCYRELAPGFDHASLTEHHRRFQQANLELVALFPHSLETLQYLQSQGYKIGAVTTRSIRTSLSSLDATGIRSFFDIVLSVEDVTNPKPDPEPILKAAEALGILPSESVMVGDTTADILCGKNAGSYTIAALYGFGGDSLLDLKPDAAIRDIKELQQLL